MLNDMALIYSFFSSSTSYALHSQKAKDSSAGAEPFEIFQVRERARRSISRFSDQTFSETIVSIFRPLLLKCEDAATKKKVS